MAYQFRIRVFYPLSSGHMVLRVDPDWDVDLEPVARDEAGSWASFWLESEEPYLYFKPVIRDGGQITWARGNNYLVTQQAAEGYDIYPYFYADPAGLITSPIGIPSRHTGHTRYVRVYTPPGYFENHLKRYPVLYMHDGSNLFFPDESFLGTTWEVDETMELLDAMSVIDKALVVGIYADQRTDEYTQPGYEGYGSFIVDELKPRIDASFRTLTAADKTAVMGSSLGGVVSMYLAWQWPEVFGKAACLSSTFTWRDDLMERIGVEPARNLRLYLDSGWPGDNYEVNRSMRDLLVSRGYVEGKDLLYLAFPNDLHSERYWAMRCHIPFQFLFGKRPRF